MHRQWAFGGSAIVAFSHLSSNIPHRLTGQAVDLIAAIIRKPYGRHTRAILAVQGYRDGS